MAKLAERLAAPALDAATLLAAWWLLPILAAQLGRAAQANLAILLGAYFLMCLGVAAAKLIQPQPAGNAGGAAGKTAAADGALAASQATLLGLSLPFSLALIAMLIIAGGLLDEQTTLGALVTAAAGNGGVGLTLLVTLGFLLLVSAFPSAVLSSPQARVASGTPAYWGIRLGSLLAVNTMVLVTVAFWEGYLAGSEPLHANFGTRVLLTLVLYPLFLLFYAAPRLALLSLEPGRYTLVGFHVMLLVYVWQLTA